MDRYQLFAKTDFSFIHIAVFHAIYLTFKLLKNLEYKSFKISSGIILDCRIIVCTAMYAIIPHFKDEQAGINGALGMHDF